MRYRLMGGNINIIPTPSGNQTLILWYSPKLAALLQDADCTNIGTSGWLRYVICRTAKYMIDKEQEGANTDKLDAEILFLKSRIENAASNRDAGIADTISETRQDPVYGGNGWGGNQGGWALFPMCFSNDIGNLLLTHPILNGYRSLGMIALCVFASYFFYENRRELCGCVSLSGMGKNGTICESISSFRNFISDIIKRCSKK